jgi:hypothetical protein
MLLTARASASAPGSSRPAALAQNQAARAVSSKHRFPGFRQVPNPGRRSPLVTASPATRVGQAKNHLAAAAFFCRDPFAPLRLLHTFRHSIPLFRKPVKAVRQLLEFGFSSSASGFSTSLGRFVCFHCLRRNSSQRARAARSSLSIREFASSCFFPCQDGFVERMLFDRYLFP